jgi:hypothetical protein
MSSESTAHPTPPHLVLRVGFAGTQRLPIDTSALSASLGNVFEALARALAEIAPGAAIVSESSAPWISQFYSKERPLLRLVTGLCEGGDSLAAEALETLAQHPELHQHVSTELAAVIPFDLPTYRASRPPEFQSEFDRQAARCSYILTLDGCYEKPDPDTPEAKNRRARAYRAQSTFLLRQADLIVAVTDPNASGGAGGTLETVRAALEFNLPVVFLDSATGRISLIEPGDDWAETLTTLGAGEDDWTRTLSTWVTSIVADPDVDSAPEPATATSGGHETAVGYGRKVLTEFFHAADTPPREPDKSGGLQRKASYGERQWLAFERRFRTGRSPQSDPVLQPYATWRARSAALAYHYSGSYRGAFLLNYVLALVAVMLAALSLVLLGSAHSNSGESHASAGEVIEAGIAKVQSAAGSVGWLFPTLLVLGAVKLWCVSTIYYNTHRANHGDWNDKAVDYRFLSERLRIMLYLPRIGNFQPPVARPVHFSSRVVRQSAVDWLVDAIVRSISPASLDMAKRETFKFPEGSYEATLLRLDSLGLLTDVRDRWIKEQAIYHDRNARTMDRLYSWAENWGKVFNIAVIGIVAVDMAIIIAGLSGKLPEAWSQTLHGLAPWLVLFATVLPAAVANLNGIRFQSECRRLADRSAVMRAILSGRFTTTPAGPPPTLWKKIDDRIRRRPIAFIRTLFPAATQTTPTTDPDPLGSKLAAADGLLTRITTATASPASDPGSWAREVLRFAESVADVFLREVAEWSVLYAKEVPEP